MAEKKSPKKDVPDSTPGIASSNLPLRCTDGSGGPPIVPPLCTNGASNQISCTVGTNPGPPPVPALSIYNSVGNARKKTTGRVCPTSPLAELSGQAKTDSSGKVTLTFSQLICGNISSFGPVGLDSFVATPISEKPCYLTTNINYVPGPPKDMKVIIYSWDSSGVLAPNIKFSWHWRTGAVINLTD